MQPEIRRRVRSKGTYEVRFSAMKEDSETFEFQIEDSFFKVFPSSEWKSGDVHVQIEVRKRADGLNLNFAIEGEVEVVCDRCLEYFPQTVKTTDQLFVKFGEEAEELDDNVIVVSKDDHELDVGQFLYEYLLLALPIQKIHPDKEDGSSGCDEKMIEKLEEHLINGEETMDPRWDELKKLKDKK